MKLLCVNKKIDWLWQLKKKLKIEREKSGKKKKIQIVMVAVLPQLYCSPSRIWQTAEFAWLPVQVLVLWHILT